jgi:hypothetical protein
MSRKEKAMNSLACRLLVGRNSMPMKKETSAPLMFLYLDFNAFSVVYFYYHVLQNRRRPN